MIIVIFLTIFIYKFMFKSLSNKTGSGWGYRGVPYQIKLVQGGVIGVSPI